MKKLALIAACILILSLAMLAAMIVLIHML